jgi:hypothetical protein
MKKTILLWLIILPVLSNAQSSVFKKRFGLARHTRASGRSEMTCSCQHLNTAVLFPRPPEVFALTSTPVIGSTFTINACIRNLKSAEDIRLTLNGEEQTIRQQTAPATNDDTFCPNGYFFSYTLTQAATRNTISLEARNEGGATVRYLDVSAVK